MLIANATTATDTKPAEHLISIRQLLNQNAGLSYCFVEPDSVVKKAYNSGAIDALSEASIDPAEYCQRIAKPPLVFEPGSSWRYSVATDVCARLFEGLAGQSFRGNGVHKWN